MTVFTYLDRLIRQQNSPPATLTIAEDHLLDGYEEGVERFLRPQESYFEIRLKQMYLRNQREYWREFRPFSTFVTAFVHSGQKREMPFVIGPQQLGEQAAALGGDAVEYRNLRVAGPFPYEGDDLQLFSALSRLTANDWAVQSLSLLETVAKAFDVSKITRYLEIAAPLVKGIESFLGMQDVELRMGMQQVYQQPVGRGGLQPSALMARHEALLNLPDHRLDSAARQQFWVKDGELFFGSRAETAQPYREADFLLFEIRPLSDRGDFTTFDFHTVNWQDTQKAIWDGSEELARQKLRLTAAALAQCTDIVRPQRNALLRKYKTLFDEDLALYQTMFAESTHRGADELRLKGVERAAALTEEVALKPLPIAPDERNLTPEQVMADLGL
ncbi:MAG: hypothetical protein KC441_07570 [Anaerolineales bacterium]|nr:hypothetical protein [Anaerolineales bacterium]